MAIILLILFNLINAKLVNLNILFIVNNVILFNVFNVIPLSNNYHYLMELVIIVQIYMMEVLHVHHQGL
jgi:hypothetical protein